jgi:hypothetical protein
MTTHQTIYTSTDKGVTWTKQAGSTYDYNTGGTDKPYDCFWNATNSLWVVIGSKSIATSPDGVTWTKRQTYTFIGSSGVSNRISASSGALDIAFVTGGVAHSTNSTTWTISALVGPTHGLGCPVWDSTHSQFVAVDGSNNHVWNSTDGVTWTDVGFIQVGFTGSTFALDLIGSTLYAANQNAAPLPRISTSTDGGATWVTETDTIAPLFFVTNGSIIVAGGVSVSGDPIVTSTTGASGSWTARAGPSPSTEFVSRGLWSGTDSQFIVVGNNNQAGVLNGIPVVMTSSNGTSWTEQTVVTRGSLTAPAAALLNSVGFSPSLDQYLIVGQFDFLSASLYLGDIRMGT